MAKKMSKLDLCWKNCLSMWGWIAEQAKSGSSTSTTRLKRMWCRANKTLGLHNNCFFCEYDANKNKGSCNSCPGTAVEEDFRCWAEEYDYDEKPIAFYNKLRDLNRKRLKP